MAHTICPCRHLCQITSGGRTVVVIDLPGYHCGFEIAGTVPFCPKYRRAHPDAAPAVPHSAPVRQLTLNL